MSENEPVETNKSEFVITALMPAIVGKMAIVYFGLNYSAYPGEGYGLGLAVSVIFTVAMIVRFLWRNRNYDDR